MNVEARGQPWLLPRSCVPFFIEVVSRWPVSPRGALVSASLGLSKRACTTMPGRNRTQVLLLARQVLYRLSHLLGPEKHISKKLPVDLRSFIDGQLEANHELSGMMSFSYLLCVFFLERNPSSYLKQKESKTETHPIAGDGDGTRLSIAIVPDGLMKEFYSAFNKSITVMRTQAFHS